MLAENDSVIPDSQYAAAAEAVATLETSKRPESTLRTIGFGALTAAGAIAFGLLGEFIHQKTGVDLIWFMRGKN